MGTGGLLAEFDFTCGAILDPITFLQILDIDPIPDIRAVTIYRMARRGKA